MAYVDKGDLVFGGESFDEDRLLGGGVVQKSVKFLGERTVRSFDEIASLADDFFQLPKATKLQQMTFHVDVRLEVEAGVEFYVRLGAKGGGSAALSLTFSR